MKGDEYVNTINIINSYNEIDEENRLQSTNARKVEFLTTIDALKPYMNPNTKVLDCGCGVGVYSLYYAKKGLQITALDLVPKHIARLNEIAFEESVCIEALVGNATDLSAFEDQSFDLTLCMGPLYHLIKDEDRYDCIQECMRVTKNDGIIAFSYISPFSVFPCVIRGDVARASKKLVDKIIIDKKISGEDDLCFWTDNFYYSPSDIEVILESFGLTIIDHLATDGQSIAFQSVINSLDEEQMSIWLDYHRMVCREKSMLGASNHGLVLARKKA